MTLTDEDDDDDNGDDYDDVDDNDEVIVVVLTIALLLLISIGKSKLVSVCCIFVVEFIFSDLPYFIRPLLG